jgi:hypothetical protein
LSHVSSPLFSLSVLLDFCLFKKSDYGFISFLSYFFSIFNSFHFCSLLLFPSFLLLQVSFALMFLLSWGSFDYWLSLSSLQAFDVTECSLNTAFHKLYFNFLSVLCLFFPSRRFSEPCIIWKCVAFCCYWVLFSFHCGQTVYSV